MKNLTFGGLRREGGRDDKISKIRKSLIQNGGPNPTKNFSILAQLERV